MNLTLYAHPFSSYCQKVLIAFYENDIPFEYRVLGPEDPAAFEEFAKLWPLKRMPALVDGDRAVVESSIIIEHLALRHPGRVQLLPQDPAAALEARFLDRYFDHYVMAPMQKIVADLLRPAESRDAYGVSDAHVLLDTSYAWLETRLAGREWAIGSGFSLADRAAAPSLFYADWVHRIPEQFANVRAYRQRLLARPSVARAVDEARPFRKLFPPGAPDRD